jgi:hypothetical protein
MAKFTEVEEQLLVERVKHDFCTCGRTGEAYEHAEIRIS